MKNARRFDRQLAWIERLLPHRFKGVTAQRLTLVRMPIAVLLIAGSVLSVLPIFGLWMLPLGLVLLAIDLPILRPSVASGVVRGRVWLKRIRARFQRGWWISG